MFDLQEYVGWFKKHIKGKDLLLYSTIFLLFFSTRLINLDKLPIFTDEGIYIRWAKVAWHDATWRFISLTDGRQPLQTWATIPLLKFFPDNMLFAGRLFGVTSGFIALFGLIVLTYYLFGKKASFIGGFLYVLTPFFLFYDRMALVDSAVNAGFVWSLFLIILLARTLRLDVALLYGLIAGITLLAKSSTRLFMGIGALAPILLLKKETKKTSRKLLNFYVLYTISAVLALVMYNVQRLSPFFHFVSEKNKTFVLTFGEFIRTPFSQIAGNLPLVPYYVFSESAYILSFLGIIGLIMLFRKDRNLAFYFFLWLILPYLAIAFFAKVIYPRYLIFSATTLLILAAYLFGQLKKNVFILVGITFLISVAFFDYTILFATNRIPFPPVDRWQYIEGVSAGSGVKEILAYARERSSDRPVILLAEGNFGVVGDMLEASLKPADRITIKGYWPFEEKNLYENQHLVGDNHVYVVFPHRTEFPGIWPITLVQKYEKLGGESALYLFELKSKER